mgnify:CR=1 FL=1
MSYSNIRNAYIDNFVHVTHKQTEYYTEKLNKTDFKHHIYIIIPCYNFQDYIEECLNSVINQKYDNYTCIIINDGSTDYTLSIINSIKNNKMIVLDYEENKGAAFGKYAGFMKARELSNPNDIVLVLDGDDYLLPNSLSKINDIYCNEKCLFTSGSHTGKIFKNDNIQLDISDINNFRKDQWIYKHPRTFKSFLL